MESNRKDTLTLWHLIPRVDRSIRPQVVARILEFVELPKEVTVDGLLQLKESELMGLRDELEMIWYEQPEWFE